MIGCRIEWSAFRPVTQPPARSGRCSVPSCWNAPSAHDEQRMEDVLTIAYWSGMFGGTWSTVVSLARIVAILVPLLLLVAYLTLWERKLIGWMHVRLGPNRVGPMGLLQPIADVLKLLLKEVIQPTQASRWIYLIAPIMTVVPAFAVWAVIPFQAKAVLGDVNAGLLYVMAISSIGVYGGFFGGRAANAKD